MPSRLVPRLLPLLLLLACNKDTPAPDSGLWLGADPAVRAEEGEARAGVVREGEAGEAALFGGVTAEGQAGDVKLYNHRVQFIIQGARPGHGYVDTSGHIIDVDLVRAEGELGRDTMEDVFLGFGMSRLFDAERVEVLADGSDGGPAVVRATGVDVAWGFFQGLFEYDDPVLDALNLDIEVLYSLAPDSDTLEVTTTLTNAGDEEVSVPAQDGVFASAEDMMPWAPGLGLEGPGGGALAAQVFTGRWGEATVSSWPEAGSYSVGTLSQLAAELGIFLADRPALTLQPGEAAELVRMITVAADPLSAEGARWRGQGETLGALTGRVTTPEGEPVAGALIHLVDAEGQVGGFARSDADGALSASLPLGAWTAYALAEADGEQVERPDGAGRYGPYAAASVNQAMLDVLAGEASAPGLPLAMGYGPAEPVSIEVTENEVAELTLVMEAPGLLSIQVDDGLGAALPAVLELRWAGALPDSPVPQALHEALGVRRSSRAFWGWTYTGAFELPVQAGDYTLSAGHSWRHDRVEEEAVALVSGELTERAVSLPEVVPRDGWLSLDAHLHGAPSFDGALPMMDRLITCAATGLDLPVTTDHDALVEYRSLAAALGLDARMHVVPGLEVTTLLRGHFNLFPLEPQDEVNGGALAWWTGVEDTQALFDAMRALVGEGGLVQVNHPRAPGMFSFANFDEETGEPGEPGRWSDDFDLMELVNEGGLGQEQVLEDWFTLLNMGARPIPVGVSDSHYRYIPCGMGRTDLFLDTDDPRGVSDEDIQDALRAGHVIVASATTLRASLDGALPGDTVVGEAATLEVSVRTPAWVQPGSLRVYRDGALLFEEALTTRGDEGLWLTQQWTLEADADAWFVVEVAGGEPLGPTWRDASPYAITNAFFLDVDGDGWTAPGL